MYTKAHISQDQTLTWDNINKELSHTDISPLCDITLHFVTEIEIFIQSLSMLRNEPTEKPRWLKFHTQAIPSDTPQHSGI